MATSFNENFPTTGGMSTARDEDIKDEPFQLAVATHNIDNSGQASEENQLVGKNEIIIVNTDEQLTVPAGSEDDHESGSDDDILITNAEATTDGKYKTKFGRPIHQAKPKQYDLIVKPRPK